jgi:hypothetical protein
LGIEFLTETDRCPAAFGGGGVVSSCAGVGDSPGQDAPAAQLKSGERLGLGKGSFRWLRRMLVAL